MLKPLDRKTFLVLLLLLIAFSLRMYRVDVLTSAANDERLWLMAGVSLLKEGAPTAWTIGWSQHRWDKYWYSEDGVVTPWLDHPPLFALFTGGWSLLMGGLDINEPNQAALRFPMVVISVVTIFFTWLLARRIFNEQVAVFVLAVYTFFPTDMVASRFILAEHTMPLLLISSMYVWLLYIDEKENKKKRSWEIVLWIICAVAPLMKLIGVIVPMTIIILASLHKHYRFAVRMILVSISSIGLFLLYAWFYSWEVFLGAQAAHMQRPQSFGHFWSLFTQLSTGNVSVTDPTMIIGWAGLFLVLAKTKSEQVRNVIFSAALTISFFFLYVASVENYDWYKYPVYPLIAIGVGFIFYRIYKGDYWYLFLFLPLLAQMLQNSGLVEDQAQRRLAMVLLYLVTMVSVLVNTHILRFKRVFLVLLLLLFFFEVVWYLHMLGSACWLSDCFPPRFRI